MLQLFQTEWCPASRRVRQRMTELGIDYVIRQVPADREQREALRTAAGVDSVPTLLADDGSVAAGEEAIASYLAGRFEEPIEAEAHRLRAAKARSRFLEEECRC